MLLHNTMRIMTNRTMISTSDERRDGSVFRLTSLIIILFIKIFRITGSSTLVSDIDSTWNISSRRRHCRRGWQPLSYTRSGMCNRNGTRGQLWGLMNIGLMNSVSWLSDRSACRNLTCGRIKASLDEVLSFWLSDQRLELGRCERVDETGLGDDEE